MTWLSTAGNGRSGLPPLSALPVGEGSYGRREERSPSGAALIAAALTGCCTAVSVLTWPSVCTCAAMALNTTIAASAPAVRIRRITAPEPWPAYPSTSLCRRGAVGGQ
jgi:hypothetical protein